MEKGTTSENDDEAPGTENLRIEEDEVDARVKKAQEDNQFNQYATKKTIAQGLLDIAMLTTSISQLKYVILAGRDQQFYGILICTISTSLVLQILVGVLLLLIGSFTRLKTNAEKYNNFVTILIFLITILNVLSTSLLDTVTTRGLYCKTLLANGSSAGAFVQMISG